MFASGFLSQLICVRQTSSPLNTRVAYSDQSSNPVCGFSMMEQVWLCTVCPMENWLGASKTTYRVELMICICYSRALERRCLVDNCDSDHWSKSICRVRMNASQQTDEENVWMQGARLRVYGGPEYSRR